jgi:hypothetical protein
MKVLLLLAFVVFAACSVFAEDDGSFQIQVEQKFVGTEFLKVGSFVLTKRILIWIVRSASHAPKKKIFGTFWCVT